MPAFQKSLTWVENKAKDYSNAKKWSQWFIYWHYTSNIKQQQKYEFKWVWDVM